MIAKYEGYSDGQPHVTKATVRLLPTPLIELRRLSARLGGPLLFMKRDDLTGLALGGNKTRKLEFLVGTALAQGCDTLITGGTLASFAAEQVL